METTIGIDQYGTEYHDLGKYPRKALMKTLGTSHVSKMYVDMKDGSMRHIGYILRGLWITLYNVTEWSKPAYYTSKSA